MKKTQFGRFLHTARTPVLITISMLLAFSLMLGGCGGSSRYSEATMPAYAVAETTAASYDTANFEGEYGYMDGGYSADNISWNEEAEDLTDSSSISPAVSTNRKLIRNVSMSVETDTFDDLIARIQKRVSELSGYIQHSDITGNATSLGGRYAYIIARIPQDKLDQFIVSVEENSNIAHKSESVQDVTLQYSDLESRKKTLTVEQDRIWALLEKADTLEAVIALEQRLSEIRYELESMESQLKLYDNQVEYSTITIDINELTPVDFTPTAPETIGDRIRKGLSRNTSKTINFLTDLFIGLIVMLPVWIPLAAVVLIVVLIVRFVRKRRQKDNCPVIISGEPSSGFQNSDNTKQQSDS